MTETVIPPLAEPRRGASRVMPALVVGVTALAFISWLLSTPPGLLGKADAIGYAVCHRIDSRSFHIGNVQMPLCARCTGTYLGALLGLVTMAALGRGRAGQLPPRPILAVLLGFIGLMGVDGINSYLVLLHLPHVYEPQNWLRLVTGTLNGLALAALIYPVFNQTVWRDWQDRPVVGAWRELGLLVALAAGLIVLVLLDVPAILYPLALLSVVGVLALLVGLNTIIVLMVARRENRAAGWLMAAVPLAAAFGLAIVQIGLVDAARYAIFGSWAGLPVG